MLVELPVYEGPAVNKLIAVRTIRRVEPDRNWTRLHLDGGESLLVCADYQYVKERIMEAE